MESLAGKTAVVTGAASGMGKAFALRFAAAGMNVVLSDIEAPALDAAVAEVDAACAEGQRAIGQVTDVSDADQVHALAASSIDTFERVHVVCNNAGVGGGIGARPDEIRRNDWEWVMGVNFWGVVYGHEAFLPHLMAHGDGHIVNTASMAGHFPGHSAYSASKWAVVGITEGLFHQLGNAGSGVGVSCLCPGWVNTQIAESARNRPEWAAPDALAEPSEAAELTQAFIRDALASGRAPEVVADQVHDAILGNQFWIFTDDEMVATLRERFDSVLSTTNPPYRPIA
ncbi:MAG: SDR family NAD(P)-dependent oxidoreductase [Acidimicrobiales bacterium]